LLQGRNFPRAAHTTQQGRKSERGSSSSVGEEQVEDVEEVEEFIIGDHDLLSEDEEDAINAANGDGDNMDATHNDEFNFDDGY
jgi:hypothetical protein